MVVDAVRPCASATMIGSDFAPIAAGRTAVANENVLSLALKSPCVPSLKNVCDDEPPIAARFATTKMPVLVGFVPGDTVTSRRTVPPTTGLAGVAEPVAVG